MLDIQSPLEMALAYAEHGWAVFPCYSVRDGACNCWKKAACAHPGKHPRTAHGFKDATTDPEKIAHWFDMWPESNVAVATGAVSGILVVDIDPDKGGFETFGALYEQGKRFPAGGPAVRTQSGGWHYYYRHPGGHVKSDDNVAGPGIDVKADGGYVLVPPSTGIKGAYAWDEASQELPSL